MIPPGRRGRGGEGVRRQEQLVAALPLPARPHGAGGQDGRKSLRGEEQEGGEGGRTQDRRDILMRKSNFMKWCIKYLLGALTLGNAFSRTPADGAAITLAGHSTPNKIHR